MADEVKTTGYARIVRRGLQVWGITEDGTETLLRECSFLGSAMEAADYFAWINGVTFETEEPAPEDGS